MLNEAIFNHQLSICKQKERGDLFFKQISEQDPDGYLYLVQQNSFIFDKLRSKFSPSFSLVNYVESYYRSFKGVGDPMCFVGVLAAETALQEIEDFLFFTQCFKNLEIKPYFHFLLIHWPRFEKEKFAQNLNFENVHRLFQKRLMNSEQNYFVRPLSVVFDSEYHLKGPDVFAKEFAKIHQAHAEQKRNDPDLVWISEFYQREESLKNLRSIQAFIDLSIRRGAYQYAQTMIFDDPSIKSSMNFLITSELNKRLVKCYRANCGIFNISIKKTNV